LLSSPVVADVSDAPGRELLVGTGLYYLRDINAAGVEGTGFPKFTGGWLFATPAVGDVDGDGKLEITAMTREGNMFLWDTDSPACGTNDEWWTSRHDEWNTGAYGTDTRPPGTPTGLTASASGSGITLHWTAPGDDWVCGTASKYRVIESTSPIDHPTDGTVVGDFSAAPAGSSESRTIANPGQNVFFAVLYQDENGNWGHLASTSISYARPKGATPFRASLLPAYNQCTAPNRTHGGALSDGSCAPPNQSSSTLTVGTPDANGFGAKSVANLVLVVVPGDVSVAFDATDVRCATTNAACPGGSGSDYTGKLLAEASLRITDKYNGASQAEDSTVADTSLELPISCVNTADATIGADCALSTTLNSLIPGMVPAGKRSIWQLGQVAVKDAGPNGTGYGAGCPSACGDGDEQTFLRQGVFVP
jgi:hypothetical protein